MRRPGVLLATVLIGLVTVARATSQDPREPVFNRVFADPTGANGFEEVVRAGDMVRGIAELDAAMMPDATMTTKRKALAQPAVQRALQLLRVGLAKPLALPRTDDEVRGQLLSLLRNVARLLGIEQTTLWADGKTAKAIDAMRDLLLLSYAVQQGEIVANLTGVAMDGIATSFARKRLGQWSQPDCAKIRRLAEAWLALPDPAIAALASERDYMARQGGVLRERGPVVALLAARYDALIGQLRVEAWKRKLPEFETGDSDDERMASQLWRTMQPMWAQVFDKWTFQIAQMQLFGVHAAIRGHLWEHGRVPDTLDELKLGRLALDPFTGTPLDYKPTGRETYELAAAGPFERGSDGQSTGRRQGFRLEDPTPGTGTRP
jgi:hypothetical protein